VLEEFRLPGFRRTGSGITRRRRPTPGVISLFVGAVCLAAASSPCPAHQRTEKALEPSAEVSGVTVTARRPTKLSELIVTATGPCQITTQPRQKLLQPELLSSFPAKNTKVRPGFLVMHVTYSEPMSTCGAYLFSDIYDSQPQLLLGRAWASKDYRTLFFLVGLTANTRYDVWLNTHQLHSIRSRWGTMAAPRRLTFSTSTAAPARTVDDLADEDDQLLPLLGFATSASTAVPPP